MANTIKVFFKGSATVSSSGGQEILDFGSLNDPTSITLTSDFYQRDRISVPTSTLTVVLPDWTFIYLGAYRTYFIPSVDGYFLWLGNGETSSSCIFCPAKIPFWLPKQTTPYSASYTARLEDTPESISEVYFYQTTGTDGYVDVLSVA